MDGCPALESHGLWKLDQVALTSVIAQITIICMYSQANLEVILDKRRLLYKLA